MARSVERKPRESGRVSKGAAVRRAFGLVALLPVASRLPVYARLLVALALDERMPAGRKAVLGGAVGYLVFGRDIVRDDIPVLGGLDDLVVIALSIDLFLEGVPRELLDEKLDELGLDRNAFDQDIAQIRRLTPGPLRSTMRRIPGAIGAIGGTIERAGIAPRLRQWIDKEESLA